MTIFDYFYGAESEQFAYYRIPRLLVTGSQFKNLSTDAKLLYGLMLDRISLSQKHDWYDSLGRVYIFFPLNEIQEALNCGHNKGVRLLSELDVGSGIGLIERIKQGQGHPTKIYVKKFIATPTPYVGSLDFPKEEVKTSENGNSGLPENGSADFPKREGIYLNNNYLENSYLNQSIYPSDPPMDLIDRNRCKELIKENIGYIALIDRFQPEVDELVELLADVLSSPQASFRISGNQLSSQIVKQRLTSLQQPHIEYVLDCMKKNTTKVRNIRGYLLTALYNAPTTMEHYYQAAVQHDLYKQQSEP